MFVTDTYNNKSSAISSSDTNKGRYDVKFPRGVGGGELVHIFNREANGSKPKPNYEPPWVGRRQHNSLSLTPLYKSLLTFLIVESHP